MQEAGTCDEAERSELNDALEPAKISSEVRHEGRLAWSDALWFSMVYTRGAISWRCGFVAWLVAAVRNIVAYGHGIDAAKDCVIMYSRKPRKWGSLFTRRTRAPSVERTQVMSKPKPSGDCG